jgi:hypothetical protein
MPTRDDLLAVAADQAANARAHKADAASAHAYAAAAKVALEAAALAEDMPPGEIAKALDDIQELLAEAGVLDEALELGPAEFLKRTFRALLAWRKQALMAQGYVVAYEGVSALLDGLERDFTTGGTETSLRIAARIRAALDDATATLKESGVIDGEEQQQAG